MLAVRQGRAQLLSRFTFTALKTVGKTSGSNIVRLLALSVIGLLASHTAAQVAGASQEVEVPENSAADKSAASLPASKQSLALRQNATTLFSNDRFDVLRSERFVVVDLKKPHQVLSTARVNGGEQQGLRYLVNHQSMEAKADNHQLMKIINQTAEQYLQDIATELQLPAEQIALMGTAANVRNLGHSRQHFKGLEVDAFVTAGVKGNALRAGDPTRWYETDSGNKRVDYHGTINTIVVINQPLTAGAQAKAAMIMVEAKSAALAELSVPSTVSPHLATGTGTDQFILASLTDNRRPSLQSASGHLKLGELIGTAVRLATLEALRWQNRLTANDTATVEYALGRFGLNDQTLQAGIARYLPKPQALLANQNLDSIQSDPRLVAAAYSYAALLDRIQYQGLPLSIRNEVLRDQAAQAAVAVSGQAAQWHTFWQQLNPRSSDMDAAVALFAKAVALGWQAKWQATEHTMAQPLAKTRSRTAGHD